MLDHWGNLPVIVLPSKGLLLLTTAVAILRQNEEPLKLFFSFLKMLIGYYK